MKRPNKNTVVTLAAPLLLLGLAAPASAHRIEKRFPVELRPVVTIRNFHGRVNVKSWQKPEVLVVAEHVSEKSEVDADQVGNRIDIVTHLVTENVGAAELEANYEITVPEETELQVKTDSGWVVIERVAGDMTIDTVTANVDLKEVAGYLVIRTNEGSLVCFRCAGRIDFRSTSGSATFTQPLSSNVRASTLSNGRITFDGDFLRGGMYKFQTYNGPIEVRFSEKDSFDLSAATQGKVENQATLKPPTHSRRLSSPFAKNSLFGTYNDGQARVELTSFNGTIRILRRENQ
jgi:DUF4097 and DUF4098 domain-containing protein YvlB